MSRLLTDNILDNVKKLCSLPINQDRFDDAYLLSIVQEILETEVYSLLKAVGHGYNVKTINLTTNSEGKVEIPIDAYLRGVEAVILDDGTELAEGRYSFESNHIAIKDYINKVITLKYFQGSLKLVPQVEVARVLSRTSNNQVEVSIPVIVNSFYIVSGKDGYITKQASRVSGTNSVFIVSEDIAQSDYIVTDSSCMVAIPLVMASLLERLVSNRLLLDIPDLEGYNQGLTVAEILKRNLIKSLASRGGKAEVITRRQTRR